MVKLDPYNFRPLYYQLAEQLGRMIDSGELQPEIQLPPEDELCLKYEVSRNTLRSCLKKLEGEGRIYRVKGRGTFVAPNVKKIRNLIVVTPWLPNAHASMQGLLTGILMRTQEENVLIQVITQNRAAAVLQAAKLDESKQSGVILLRKNSMMPEHFGLAKKYGFPVIAEGISDLKGGCTIDIDNADAMRKIIKHLYSLGHRVFGLAGFESSKGQITHYSQREDAVGRLLTEFGVPLLPENRIIIPGPEAAPENFSAFFRRKNAPTALISETDHLAAVLYRTAASAGIRIPQDISIVGFDDAPFAGFLNPPLTTIRQDYCQLGFMAADHILRMMSEYQTRSFHLKQKLELVIRNSTTEAKG